MKPSASFLTAGICLSLSVAAYADTTGSLNCNPFPATFMNGQGGPAPVVCPAFTVPGATLTGVRLTYLADYQFGLSAANTVVVTFNPAGPANVTWEPSAPLSVSGGISPSEPLTTGAANATGGVTAAAFASPFTVNLSSTVTAGSVASSSGAVSVVYTYNLLVPVTLACPANSATDGVPYNSALVATGAAPYLFTIPLGRLPDGLLLNSTTGAITGTPTTIGLFIFTSQVLSGAQPTAVECRITVQPTPAEGLVLADTLGAPPLLRGGGAPVRDTSAGGYSALAVRFRITGAAVTLSHFDLAMSVPQPNNLTVSIYRDSIGVPGQGGALGDHVASTTLVNAPYVCVPGLVAGSPDLFVNQVGNNVCNAPGPPRNNIPIVRGTMPGNVVLTPGDYWMALSSICSPNFCPVWYLTPFPGIGVAGRLNTTNQWASIIDAPYGLRLYGGVPNAPVSVTVGTFPAGIGFSVDGASYSGAQTFSWAQNGQHTLEANLSQTVSGIQYIFDKWSDGVTTRSRIITAGTVSNYTAQYKLMPGRTWVRKWPVASPPAQSLPAMASDVQGRLMLFLGWSDTSGSFGETWIWEGASWTRMAAIGPLARSEYAMAFDSSHGEVVLFGGIGSGLLGDTWIWDGVKWTSKQPALSPAPRIEHAMAYDAARGQVVLFGGRKTTDRFSDTWIWNGATWTQKLVAGPSARVGHAMAYDPVRRHVVLFGGRDVSGFSEETWIWDGTTWTQSAVPGPPARAYSGMAFDSAHGQIVLFGGQNDSGYLQDTWVWDGASWTQAMPDSSPPGRLQHAMAYDEDASSLVLFGGFLGARLTDTWVWTEAEGTPIGNNVTTQPDSAVSVTFSSVIGAGTTTVSTPGSGPPPPSGFTLGNPFVYYDIETTASYSGAITICISYVGISFKTLPPVLFHYEGGAWKNVTTSHDAMNKVVCGSVTSLSPFALFRKIDTTAPVITPSITGALGTNGWYTSNVNVSWNVHDPESGIASQTNCSSAALTANSAGTTLTCSATNGEGLTSSVPVTVNIDKTAPGISGMPAAGCSLWPANGKLVQVATVTAADALSGINTFSVTGTSNEPSNPKNPDIVITPIGGGGYSVQLRADRLGTGAGRVYTLTATAMDRAGNVASVTGTCTVPHDKR